LVTAENTNVREVRLVGRHWVLDATAYSTNERGDPAKASIPVPLSSAQQRELVLAVAESILPGSGTVSAAGRMWRYTAPGTHLSLTLPASWDVRDGAFDDGSIYLHDTGAVDGPQLFLYPVCEEYDDDDWACQVLDAITFDSRDDPSQRRVIQAVVYDTRTPIGKATFQMFVADTAAKGIPCGSTRGVTSGRGTVLLTNSLQFDTLEQAADWVGGDDYRAVVAVMKTLDVTR
jgi:hypothetical protein